MADDLFAYAGQVSGTIAGAPEEHNTYIAFGYSVRRENGPFLSIWADPERGNSGLLQVLAAAGGMFVGVAEVCASNTLGWHTFGLSDLEGFIAMGVVELVVHLHDVTQAFNVSFDVSAALCEKLLVRLFPIATQNMQEHAADPWIALLWATGRSPLGPLPRQEIWAWDATVRD
jgi:hypothetical protein